MKARPLLIISTLTAILPLTIGSLIFWTYFFYPDNDLVKSGILTILIAIPLCFIGLILTIIYKLKNKTDLTAKHKANRNLYLTLLNIPVCVFYVWFALYLMDTERINIINNSDKDITDIKVFGVGDIDLIDKIGKGESKTVWVHMTKEGSIKMLYKEIGQLKARSLEGYTGPNMGGHRHTRHVNPTEEDLK